MNTTPIKLKRKYKVGKSYRKTKGTPRAENARQCPQDFGQPLRPEDKKYW